MLIIIVGNKLSRKIGCILCSARKISIQGRLLEIPRGRFQKPKFFKESTKHNQNIQRGHWGWGGGGLN